MALSGETKNYWFAWGGALGGLLGFFIAFTGLQTVQGWCEADNINCSRDWISALGAWAAIPAAVITIVSLSSQVRNADKYHRESMRVQHRRSRTLAKKAIKEATFLLHYSRASEDTWRGATSGKNDRHSTTQICEEIKVLSNLLDDDVYDRLEAELDFPALVGVAMVRDRISEYANLQVGLYMEHSVIGPQMWLTYGISADYAEECLGIARRHLEETEMLISPDQ